MDIAVLTFFNQTLAHPLLDWLALALTLGGFALLPGLGAALLIGPHRKIGWAILLALGVGLVAAFTFQYLGMRPRPTGVRLIQQTPDFPSFPSGHATAAFSTAVVLILASRSKLIGITASILAVLIALSRLYLGHHYPSDIVAGAVLGASLGLAAYGLLLHAPRQSGTKSTIAWHWLLWPQVALVLVVSAMAYLSILPYHLLQWPLADKVIHFLLAGALAFWLNLWVQGRRVRFKTWSIPFTLLVLGTLAILEEGSQGFSSRRTLSLADLSSNLLGLYAFWWLSQQVLRRQHLPHHR